MPVSGAGAGFLIGLFPTLAMIAATYLLTNVEVGEKVEAGLQNFAAGLILAAVAGELFPIMLDGDDGSSAAGVTLGFIIGLSTIYGIESLVEYLEELPAFGSSVEHHHDHDHDHKNDVKNPLQKKGYSALEEVESGRTPATPTSLKLTLPKGFDDEGSSHSNSHLELVKQMTKDLENPVWEETSVEYASQAIARPEHRNHILEHLRELLDCVVAMEQRSQQLTNPQLKIREIEDIAENIDEQIHNLQYKLDHSRRLLQGSETHGSDITTNHATWVTDDRKVSIKKCLTGLRNTVEHLLEHINEPNLDKHVLQEMRIHMDHMDKQIIHFHESIEHVGSRWHRQLPKIDTVEGDKLPMGLVLPVSMDCFVDGFLIGISSSVSLKAGIILSCANCLEMAFLGMAYASRLVKCTGSSPLAINIALYGPPFIMFFAAGIGAAIGSALENNPTVFIGMVAFGTVALLFLVCNELLIEAREAQGEDERWYISIMVFVGVYIVIMLDHLF